MLYDITPPITPSTKVWPGDTPPAREVLLDMRRGDHLTLSTLRTSVHVGAHADGPKQAAHIINPNTEDKCLATRMTECSRWLQ